MRRGQDAAAAAVSFAEVHQVNAEGLLQIAQHMAGLSVAGYEPPKELRLRTAGAHKKKAEALAKDGAHDEAAEHVLRALLRPGLEESVMAQLKAQLERAMQKLVQQRQTEQKEADWGAFLAEVRAGTGGEAAGAAEGGGGGGRAR